MLVEALQAGAVKHLLTSSVVNELAVALPPSTLLHHSSHHSHASAHQAPLPQHPTDTTSEHTDADDGRHAAPSELLPSELLPSPTDGAHQPLSPPPLSLHDFEPVGVLGFGSSAQVRLMRNRRANGALHAVKSVFRTRGGKALSAIAVERVRKELTPHGIPPRHPIGPHPHTPSDHGGGGSG